MTWCVGNYLKMLRITSPVWYSNIEYSAYEVCLFFLHNFLMTEIGKNDASLDLRVLWDIPSNISFSLVLHWNMWYFCNFYVHVRNQ